MFERWVGPEEGLDVGGEYSRRAWLPALGRDAWLVWGAIAGDLGRYRRVACLADDLALAHGLCRTAVGPAVERLVRFGLAVGPAGPAGRTGVAGFGGSAGLADLGLPGGGRSAAPSAPGSSLSRLGPCGGLAGASGREAGAAGGPGAWPTGEAWRVRRACPPLCDGMLTYAPGEVVAMHLRLFGDGLHHRPPHRWTRRHRPRLASGRAS